MALTKAEMRNKILRRLRVLPEGQDARSVDAEIVESAIDQAHAQLEAAELAYWSVDSTPDGVAKGMADFVAGQVAVELVDISQATQYAGLEAAGMRAIRQFCALGDADVKAVFY